MDFAVLKYHGVKIKDSDKKDKFFDLARKFAAYEGEGNTNYNWSVWNGPQMIGKGGGRVENWWTNRDYPD